MLCVMTLLLAMVFPSKVLTSRLPCAWIVQYSQRHGYEESPKAPLFASCCVNPPSNKSQVMSRWRVDSYYRAFPCSGHSYHETAWSYEVSIMNLVTLGQPLTLSLIYLNYCCKDKEKRNGAARGLLGLAGRKEKSKSIPNKQISSYCV